MQRAFMTLALGCVALLIMAAFVGCKPADTPTEETVPATGAPAADTPSVPAADVPAPAADEAADDADAPQEIVGKEAFDAFIASAPIALVDFSATWCPPCQKLAPYIDKMGKAYAKDGVKVAKIDVDQNQDISRELGVENIPDVRIYVNGEQTDRIVGNNPMGLMNKLENAVKAAGNK
ncbi:MAG: thioredoxin family protein [Thermoguttaceae bacterium]|nr:thioredoxin family protein [Thermoguttaceae bacterium]